MSSIPEREAKIHMNMFRRPPMTLVKGKGARVEDSDGKSYVDCVAGIAVDALGLVILGSQRLLLNRQKN